MAREGARVIIADLDEARGKAAANKIRRRAQFVRHDVRNEEDWTALADYLKRKFRRIDVLVNNAGIYLIKPVAETTVEDLEEILATNVRGVFLGMKHFAPLMAQRKRGSIINISSMDGNVGSEGHTAWRQQGRGASDDQGCCGGICEKRSAGLTQSTPLTSARQWPVMELRYMGKRSRNWEVSSENRLMLRESCFGQRGVTVRNRGELAIDGGVLAQ